MINPCGLAMAAGGGEWEEGSGGERKSLIGAGIFYHPSWKTHILRGQEHINNIFPH